jgi:hypothetical protein
MSASAMKTVAKLARKKKNTTVQYKKEKGGKKGK